MSMVALASAATLNVQNRAPVGFWPFAITVACTDLSVFNFSLYGEESSSFFFPDATPIDCSISQALTVNQTNIFTSSIWDTYGADDGQISEVDAALVDGQTFYVTNTLKGWGKLSSLESGTLLSSISSQTSEETTTPPNENNNNTSSSATWSDSFWLSVGVADPYTCGEGFVGQVSSDDISQTQVTITLQQQGKNVKIFSPALNAQWMYNQSINYTDLWSPLYVATGTYAVIVTATYKWVQDSVSFITNITQECTEQNYLDMLRERNAHIIDAQKNSSTENNSTEAVKKPTAPKKLPNTGAEA